VLNVGSNSPSAGAVLVGFDDYVVNAGTVSCGSPPPPGCTASLTVSADNSNALGLFEGTVDAVSQGAQTLATLTISPTRVIFNPLGFGRRGLALWFEIVSIRYDSDITEIEPDETDLIGGVLARQGLVAPKHYARYVTSFCGVDEVSFTLKYTNRASALTLLDAIIPVASLETAKEFGEALLGVPLYSSAVSHLVAAWSAQDIRTMMRELGRVGDDLRLLAGDSTQLREILAIFARFEVELTLRRFIGRLLSAPVRLFEVYIDTLVVMLQTGITARDVEISFVAR
jgi:hypothetical protein